MTQETERQCSAYVISREEARKAATHTMKERDLQDTL